MSGDPMDAGSVVALGELSRLEGYALAGVELRAAETEDEALRQWGALDERVGVVFLTPRSADALGVRIDAVDAPMTVVLPE